MALSIWTTGTWGFTIFFGLKEGQDLENQVAHPHQELPGVPPLGGGGADNNPLRSALRVHLYPYGFQFNWSRNEIIILLVQLACENIRFSSLFAAGDVSRGGTSAAQRQNLLMT